jgi:hypothetical protein
VVVKSRRPDPLFEAHGSVMDLIFYVAEGFRPTFNNTFGTI